MIEEEEEFDPNHMRIVLRIESNIEKEMELLVEAVKEKFPHWKFDIRKSVQLPRKGSGQGLLKFYQAEASFTREEHITG